MESDTSSNGIIDECKTIPVQLDHLYPGARISCEEYSVTLFRCSKSIALFILVSKIYSNYLLKFYPSQILCLDHSMFFSRALLILILILLFTVAVCIAHKVKRSFYTFLPVHIFCSCLSKRTSINVASDAFAALHSTRWQTELSGGSHTKKHFMRNLKECRDVNRQKSIRTRSGCYRSTAHTLWTS